MNVSGNYFALGPTGDVPPPRAKQFYGGTRLAARMGRDYVNYTSPDGAELFAVPYGLGIWAIDVPLSLVGDTLTLPVTIPAEINHSIEEYYFRPGTYTDEEPTEPAHGSGQLTRDDTSPVRTPGARPAPEETE